MISSAKIRAFFLILAGFILVAATGFMITTCDSPTDQHNGLKNSPDGDTRLVVAMHDAPFKMEDKDVQELNITVLEIVIYRQQ
jgi:hypothetical protein